MQSFEAVCHILISSAQTIGAFNTGFDTVNLHRLTSGMMFPPKSSDLPLSSGAS
jgi:hypothetical protein